ncbi:hypothetical protein GWI33_006012 [Rhynchophorus ferrugineus]|uniref:SWIM-type domain-containing protein n=1 Tax=Rhynchophorus ferrugineus TaxID=354439 RepID=A0A834MPM6_RHYFE|nr:hypothetical protein GWI33_006012 [Rhynchophorus ferrugineus]
MKRSIIPKLAFKALKDAELNIANQGTFSNESLEKLYSYFDETFLLATELLEKCKIQQFSTPDRLRKIYKISVNDEYYTVFDNINFCMCEDFQLAVLNKKSQITCKHVLAVNIAKVTKNVSNESITPLMYENFLNEQIHCLYDT